MNITLPTSDADDDGFALPRAQVMPGWGEDTVGAGVGATVPWPRDGERVDIALCPHPCVHRPPTGPQEVKPLDLLLGGRRGRAAEGDGVTHDVFKLLWRHCDGGRRRRV